MILNQCAGGGPGNLDAVTARPDTVLQGFTFVDRDGNLRPGEMAEVTDGVYFNPANGSVQGAPGHYAAGPQGTPQQAGAPYVDTCTFDRQTKQITVRARTPKAGWISQPVGNAQSYSIDVDLFDAYVYKYNVTNDAASPIRVSTSGESDIVVNGQQVPRLVYIEHGQTVAVYSNIMSLRAGANNESAGFEAIFSGNYIPLGLTFMNQENLYRTSEGYLLIEKMVTVTRPR